MLNVQPLYAPRTGPQAAPPMMVPMPGVVPVMPGMPGMVGVPIVQPLPPLAHRGTLQPGQKMQIGQYEVVVERYLAEGGYAHVYLVQTATPIQGETRHVLKRIACASDDILHEVGMEVQVMKLLRGHPNIVHLHSATSEPQADGSSVVYILMEFCAGGGIIDYMNRRLRERLTEKEILQIFVDVCEGVASMHALRPPLLHRDLKIENILQSSPNLYKLCDFGSAAAVTPPPANLLQLRLLEADLNKHTTLQYRAPEMVDVSQRRPIDTKSDVWALGVLLYKLCYYTTPFEAHGQVAIMTASYKIPTYPVYSSGLNGLIGKMLQERGTSRPSVFEILEEVHRMRGTRSQFHYDITVPAPLSPTKLPKSPALTAAISARDAILDSISPPPIRTHISGPATRSAATGGRNGLPVEDVWRAERSRQQGLQAAMLGERGKISPAFTPAAGASPVERQAPAPAPWENEKDIDDRAGPAPAPKPSFVSQRIGQLGQQSVTTPPAAQARPAPAVAPKPSTATAKPTSIPLPSPALSSTTSQPRTKTPAYLSPDSLRSLSAEERFPSIDQLSTDLDQAFSPPLAAAERGKPLLDREQKLRETASSSSSDQRAPWLARRSPSPTKAANGAGSGKTRPVFSPPVSSASGTGVLSARGNFVGRPNSAEPTFSAPRKQETSPPSASTTTRNTTTAGDTGKVSMPERTNPPMKRLESDFAKPRKRTKKRTSTSDEPAVSASGSKSQPEPEKEQERKPTKPRDWLTGSFDADDPTLSAPAAASQDKPVVQSKPAGLPSTSSTSAAATKPVLPQRPSETGASSVRRFVRSPEPVPVKETPTSAQGEMSTARTSPFKRHSMAIPQATAAGVAALSPTADGPPPRLPARPQSGVFSPPSLKSVALPKPTDKPAFMRSSATGQPTTSLNLKVDTSPRKPVPTLTDNWSPIESTTRHARKESSDDDGPEDAQGGAIRTLRRQFEQSKPEPAAKPAGIKPLVARKPVPVISPTSPVKSPTTELPKPATAAPPNSPTKVFAARFPDLVSLDAKQPSSTGDAKPVAAAPAAARRSPLPSPNIMDEANEDLLVAAPARPSAFGNRNGRSQESATSTTSGPPTARPRPQSMFLSSSMMQTMSSLQPPPDTSKVAAERRSPRRGSISEMVSKYEALNSPGLTTSGQVSPGKELTSSNVIPSSSDVKSASAKAPSPAPEKPSSFGLVGRAEVAAPKEPNLAPPTSGANGALSRRRTVAAAPSGGVASAYGPPKAQIGLPGLAKLSSVPERSPSVPVRQNIEVMGDYKPRALPGLAKPPSSPTKQPSYLATPANANPPIHHAPSPAQAGLPMRPISPIGTPLPAPKPTPVAKPSTLVSQSTANSKPAPSIIAPTPRRADPSPGPPSAGGDGVDTSFQGVGKLVAQWQKKAQESTNPGSNAEDKKATTWQRLR